MPDWIGKELRSNFARASCTGRLAAITEPRAARVVYSAQKHALRIELTNGATITLPVKLIPSLRRAGSKDLRAVEVLRHGGGLHWESLDVGLSVPGHQLKKKSKAMSVVVASAAMIMSMTCTESIPVKTLRRLWRGVRCLTSKVIATAR